MRSNPLPIKIKAAHWFLNETDLKNKKSSPKKFQKLTRQFKKFAFK